MRSEKGLESSSSVEMPLLKIEKAKKHATGGYRF
jgi:hypothetical protein